MPKPPPTALDPDELRWHCDPAPLRFETTREVDPASEVVGQAAAREALRFGLECDAPGQNVYVRGARGTGRMTMIRKLLRDLAPVSDGKRDRCYVHNFSRPDRPRLITLPPGQARAFRRLVVELAAFLRDGLVKALGGEPYASERSAIQERAQADIEAITAPLGTELRQAEMALVPVQQGSAAQAVIRPVVNGQPVPLRQFQQRVAQGELPAERLQEFESRYPEFQKRLEETGRRVHDATRAMAHELTQLKERATRELLGQLTQRILEEFSGNDVHAFIEGLIDDVIETRLDPSEGLPDPCAIYGVNIVLDHNDPTRRPIVEEYAPSAMNLLGAVEPDWVTSGQASSSYRGIRAGALLRADCGYLIVDVDDLLAEPGAWRAMIRTLRTGKLEIVPPEVNWMSPNRVLQPEPIAINVRVILVGDAGTYYRLDQGDPDFRDLFKVLADFDSEIDRSDESVRAYAAIVARLSQDEGLLPFHRSGVAALAEHGARIAARAGKLTARFGRISDIAREASFVAGRAARECVLDEHVRQAVARTKERGGLPSRRFQEMIQSRTIILETDGSAVGQINGLAVINAGPLTYGFPARITATIGPGSAGLINIEGRAQMSGSIHTKGFHILGGLLRHLLRTSHPLAFSASIAFEQSYGGIDGDSASGAEVCCLLSALTDIPIKQSFAMTGAIDQRGHMEAIGGLNEKVEGFYDTCNYFGLNGEQGVIIPSANAGDLMLREDVVAACERNEFHVHAVETIHQAIEILTGFPAGERAGDRFPEGTVLHKAVQRAEEFWRRTLQSPRQLTSVETTRDRDDDIVMPYEPER